MTRTGKAMNTYESVYLLTKFLCKAHRARKVEREIHGVNIYRDSKHLHAMRLVNLEIDTYKDGTGDAVRAFNRSFNQHYYNY